MITFLCWYFGISIIYTFLYYLILTSDKVFSLLLEHGKDKQFNAFLSLRLSMLYTPITMFTLSVVVSPINIVLLTLLAVVQLISKGFIIIVGRQEEKYRLKSKVKSGDSK